VTDIKVFQTERDKEMYGLGRKDALESLMQEVEKVKYEYYDKYDRGRTVIDIDDLKAVVERLK